MSINRSTKSNLSKNEKMDMSHLFSDYPIYINRSSQEKESLNSKRTQTSLVTMDKSPKSVISHFNRSNKKSRVTLLDIKENDMEFCFQPLRLSTQEFKDEFYCEEEEDSVYQMDKEWLDTDSEESESEEDYDGCADIDPSDLNEWKEAQKNSSLETKGEEEMETIDQKIRKHQEMESGTRRSRNSKRNRGNVKSYTSFFDFDESEVGIGSSEFRGKRGIKVKNFKVNSNASRFR